MKTYKNLWEQFVSKENFELAYKNSIKNKSGQHQIIEFKKNRENNLEKVRQSVVNGTFHTSEYKEMKIYEPKERIIYKLPYSPDRIVQHAIMNVLKPIFTNLFIENSFACIEGRGQLKASQKCAEYVRKNDYCLKCDIHKFYPSINQQTLSDMIHRIIKDNRFMDVIDDVIFSFEGGYNCPIGNLCSQWFGNFYLTKLDNFVLHELKPRGYIRYCDDFLLFDNDKTHLNRCRDRMSDFLQRELELEYSKAELFNVKQGVDFVGYRHFKKFLLVRKSTGKRLKKRCQRIDKKFYSLNLDTTEGQLASGNGLIKHACTHNFRRSLKLDELTEKVRKAKWERKTK